MVPCRGIRPLAGAMLASAVPLGAAPSFGDTVTVENRLGTVISPGWVIIRQATSGPLIFNPHFPTRWYLTLVYLYGAPVGEVIEVLGQSPIPAGWVKTATYGDKGLDKLHYKLRFRIEKQFEADPPEGGGDLPPVLCLPLELDVASMDPKAADKENKQKAEALAGKASQGS